MPAALARGLRERGAVVDQQVRAEGRQARESPAGRWRRAPGGPAAPRAADPARLRHRAAGAGAAPRRPGDVVFIPIVRTALFIVARFYKPW